MHAILTADFSDDWHRGLAALLPVIAALVGAIVGATGNAFLERHRRSREHRLHVQETGLEFIELAKETNRWNLEHAHSAKTEEKSHEAVRKNRALRDPDVERQIRMTTVAEQDRLKAAEHRNKFESYKQQLKEQNRKFKFLAPDLDEPREILFKRATGHAPAGNPQARNWVVNYRLEEKALWEHLREYVDLAQATRRYKRWARRRNSSTQNDAPEVGA